jgi:hypothetical protein
MIKIKDILMIIVIIIVIILFMLVYNCSCSNEKFRNLEKFTELTKKQLKTVTMYTYYPGGIYTITFDGNVFNIIAENSDNYKITNEEQKEFMNKLLNNTKSYMKIKDMINGTIDFKNTFVCLEDFRNIHYGLIDNLINDNSQFTSNKIGSFGYLCGDTKPFRLKYIDYCKTNPMICEYISTNKYSPNDKTMLSFIDMKKFKYLIDLPGHNYSTKIYSFIHSKRVIFKVKGVTDSHEFYWEKYLKPNIHYIEINEDYSDLMEKYRNIEKNPSQYNDIINNCNLLIKTEISQDKLLSNFLHSFLL